MEFGCNHWRNLCFPIFLLIHIEEIWLFRTVETLPDAISGKMSSRIAISIDTAHHLSQQLNQLLSTKPSTTVAQSQQSATDPVLQSSSSSSTAAVDSQNAQKSDKNSFRFPWSKKTD